MSRRALLERGSDGRFRQLVYDLLTISVRMETVRSIWLERIGISGPQYSVLVAIAQFQARYRSQCQQGGAGVARVSGAFITTETGRLERLGLVVKAINPRDRRGVLLRLTPRARRQIDRDQSGDYGHQRHVLRAVGRARRSARSRPRRCSSSNSSREVTELIANGRSAMHLPALPNEHRKRGPNAENGLVNLAVRHLRTTEIYRMRSRRAMISYFVRYRGSAADPAAFVELLRDSSRRDPQTVSRHPYAVAARAGGLERSVPGTPDGTALLAQMTFDTPADSAARACSSEARRRAREDFARFPPFSGEVTHQAMRSHSDLLMAMESLHSLPAAIFHWRGCNANSKTIVTELSCSRPRQFGDVACKETPDIMIGQQIHQRSDAWFGLRDGRRRAHAEYRRSEFPQLQHSWSVHDWRHDILGDDPSRRAVAALRSSARSPSPPQYRSSSSASLGAGCAEPNQFVPLVSSMAFLILFEHLAVVIWGSEMRPLPIPVRRRRLAHWPLYRERTAARRARPVIRFHSWPRARCFVTPDWVVGLRTIAEDSDTALLLGVDVNQLVPVVFVLAGLFAAVAGALFAIDYRQVHPFMGEAIGLKGISAMIVGGMGNVWGAIIGGLIIGIAEVLSVGYIGANFVDISVFGLLLLILMVRPTGLSRAWPRKRGGP